MKLLMALSLAVGAALSALAEWRQVQGFDWLGFTLVMLFAAASCVALALGLDGFLAWDSAHP